MKKYSTLDEFFTDQSHDNLKLIKLIREIITSAEPSLIETLKWNAPNYIYHDQDRFTFNLMNKENKVKLIIHMGAKKKENKAGKPILDEDYGIVTWNSDIRGTIEFINEDDVIQKTTQLQQVVKDWLAVGT
jgi:hypothetical protein